MEEFAFRTKIAAGPGAVAALKELGAHRLFLVTEAPFSENGMAQKVIEAAGSREAEIFDAVPLEPTASLAAEVTARCAAFGPDLLAALGSSGAIDCAKAALYFGERDIPFVTIPVRFGSGSQVTDFLELTHEHRSYTLKSPRFQPVLTVLEEDFLGKEPPALAGEAGFSLLAYALESYTARNAGTLPSIFAREAFRTAYACLPAAVAGDAGLRRPEMGGAGGCGADGCRAGTGRGRTHRGRDHRGDRPGSGRQSLAPVPKLGLPGPSRLRGGGVGRRGRLGSGATHRHGFPGGSWRGPRRTGGGEHAAPLRPPRAG